MIKRNNCVICSSPFLEHLTTFNNMPVFPHFHLKNEIFKTENQTWVICKECGCIQLENLIGLDELYGVSHNSITGKTWETHNNMFINYIEKNMGEKILEIGGGNLSICNILIKKEKIKKYKLYDKNINIKKINSQIEYSETFFESNTKEEEKFNTIILSHTLEHFYNPKDYLEKFYNLLEDNGKLIFSVPHIINGLKSYYTNALNFEHTYSIDMENINFLLYLTGFKYVDSIPFSDYNFFITYEKSKKQVLSLENNYKRNKKIFNNYVNYYSKEAIRINKLLEKENSDGKYIFGCGPFSQFLIYMGLNIKDFSGVLDEDKNKQSHFLYGTELCTFDPVVIKELKNPIVILKAASYTTEISERLISINNNVKIIK